MVKAMTIQLFNSAHVGLTSCVKPAQVIIRNKLFHIYDFSIFSILNLRAYQSRLNFVAVLKPALEFNQDNFSLLQARF